MAFLEKFGDKGEGFGHFFFTGGVDLDKGDFYKIFIGWKIGNTPIFRERGEVFHARLKKGPGVL